MPPQRYHSATLTLFLDLGGLAAQIPQVVELRAADVAEGDQLDVVDVRGMHRKGALDADAEADLADREGLADAATLSPNDVTGEHLDPGAGALDDLHVHLDRVTGPEVRDVGPQRGGIQRVKGVHGVSSSFQAVSAQGAHV